MKTKFIIFLLIFLFFLEFGEADIVEINISGKVFSDSNVTVELYLFPRNTSTQESYLETFPKAKISKEKIVFSLDKGVSDFHVKAIVKTNFTFKKINFFSSFELKEPGNNEYIDPTEHIDIENWVVKYKAKQLKENVKSNNNLELLHEIAEYTRKSIKYNEAYSQPQKASWILENKIGVCVHYTTLFIALCRALGFPARYVSGVVYSDEKKEYIGHAWAEVYLEGQGWIPYDVTLGQYGWIDSGHIVMKYSKDPAEPSLKYIYVGGLEAEKLSIQGKRIEKEEPKIEFEITLKPYKEKISLGSYVPVEVEVENKNDFYFSLPLYLTKAPGNITETTKVVFLKPKEKTKTYFLVHIPKIEECKKGCISEIEVKDFFNNSGSTTIMFSESYPEITLDQARAIIKTGFIDFFCSTEKEYYFENETVIIKCLVQLEEKEKFKICHSGCLEIEEKNISVNFTTKPKEKICVTVLLKNETLENCFSLEIIKRPEVKILDIETKKAPYGSIVILSADLSSNVDTKGKIVIYKEKKKVVEYLITIKRGKNILFLPLKTWKLRPGQNNLTLFLFYDSYFEEKNFSIYVEEVSFLKRMFFFIKNVFDF